MIPPQKERYKADGSVSLIIIVLLLLGGGLFFLYQMRRSSEAEGRQFAREVIEHCAFQHDLNFLHSAVAPNRRPAIPPGKDQDFIETLAKLGLPDRNYTVTGGVTFVNYFFSPRGRFESILTFLDRHGTFFVNIERPSGIWLVEDYGVLWERPPD
jgi:hypothetical protein